MNLDTNKSQLTADYICSVVQREHIKSYHELTVYYKRFEKYLAFVTEHQVYFTKYIKEYNDSLPKRKLSWKK